MKVNEVSSYYNSISEIKQIAEVKKDGYAIKHISHPSDAVQMAAVKNDGSAIKYIDNPSEAVQLAAINNYINSIEYIDHPTPKVQISVIKNDPSMMFRINKVSRDALNECKHEIIKYILTRMLDDNILYLNSVFSFFRQNHIDWPELKIMKKSFDHDLASKQNPIDEDDKNEPSFGQMAVILKNNPPLNTQLKLVNLNWRTMVYIDNPSEEVQLAAIKQNVEAIKFIDHPSKEVQVIAIKKNPCVIMNYIYGIVSADVLNECKFEIIKYLLTRIKNRDKVFISEWIRILKNAGIYWPEIDIIKKSLYAEDRSLVEDDNQDEITQIGIVSKYPFRLKNIKNPSEKVQLAAVTQEPSVIRFIPDPSEKVQLKAVFNCPEVIQCINNPVRAAQVVAISRNPTMVIANGHCLDKITDEVINACKKVIIKKTLQLIMHTYYFNAVERILNGLATRNIQWPEIDTIKKSFEFESHKFHNDIDENQILNEIDDITLQSLIDNYNYKIVIYRLSNDNYPSAQATLKLKVIFDKNKHKIVTILLTGIKNGLDNYTLAVAIPSAISFIERCGIHWPELNIIKKSLEAESSKKNIQLD